jgi:hypothetical protein
VLPPINKRCHEINFSTERRSVAALAPNYALDRLSRYEATPWRQVGQILFALDNLDRRKPQERMRRFPRGLRDPAEMNPPG